MKTFFRLMSLITMLSLAACAQDSQNVYSESDVGRAMTLSHGKITAMRSIKIQGKSKGGGALAGTVIGGGAGSAVGQDAGNAVATIGGVLIGAAIGALAEEKLRQEEGIEYTVAYDNGKTAMIAQNIAKDDIPLKVGQRVVVQENSDRDVVYHRVLPEQTPPPKP